MCPIVFSFFNNFRRIFHLDEIVPRDFKFSLSGVLLFPQRFNYLLLPYNKLLLFLRVSWFIRFVIRTVEMLNFLLFRLFHNLIQKQILFSHLQLYFFDILEFLGSHLLFLPYRLKYPPLKVLNFRWIHLFLTNRCLIYLLKLSLSVCLWFALLNEGLGDASSSEFIPKINFILFGRCIYWTHFRIFQHFLDKRHCLLIVAFAFGLFLWNLIEFLVFWFDLLILRVQIMDGGEPLLNILCFLKHFWPFPLWLPRQVEGSPEQPPEHY